MKKFDGKIIIFVFDYREKHGDTSSYIRPYGIFLKLINNRMTH